MIAIKALRGLITLAIGLFWGYCDYYVTRNGAGKPTTVGFGALALLFVLIGTVQFMRAIRPPRPRGEPRDRDDPPVPSGIDADAVIRDYLERKGNAPAAPLSPDPPPSAPPPRRGFGRKPG